MKQRLTANLTTAAKGRFKVLVVDRHGRVVHERPWQKNLLLDVGLNQLVTTRWGGLGLVAAVGTGATPTQEYSGAITASQTGTTVTLSATFSGAANGRLIRWDSGHEAKIVSGSGASWEMDRSQSVASGPFTVYRVNQTKLATYVKRTNTYLTGADHCGTVLDAPNGLVIMKRTYDFTLEVSNQNYTEIGISWNNVVDPDLFSRMLIDGGSLTILTGQQLRVVHELTLALSPVVAAHSFTADIAGWPVAPSTSLAAVSRIQRATISGINTSGGNDHAVTGTQGYGLEPSQAGATGITVGLSTTADPPAVPFNTITRTGVGVYAVARNYVVNSFERLYDAVFPGNTGNSTAYRSITFGSGGSGTPSPTFSLSTTSFVVVFEENQTKDNLHMLSVTFRNSWGRDLS
jgi:hypothetical protein